MYPRPLLILTAILLALITAACTRSVSTSTTTSPVDPTTTTVFVEPSPSVGNPATPSTTLPDEGMPPAPTVTAPVLDLDRSLRSVPPTEAAELLSTDSKTVLLDLRTLPDTPFDTIPGAVYMDASDPEFINNAAALDPAVPYIIYSEAGTRSTEALRTFDLLGFFDVTEIEGGLQAWVSSGLPTTEERTP